MSTSSGRDRPRRPVHFSLAAMEALGASTPGPAEQTEVAHASAEAVVGIGRAARDPEVTARLVALVDELGLDTIAALWAARPAGSLPGALWRLYALREWVLRSPQAASREYAAGMRLAETSHVIAGAAEPPGPAELSALVDAILTGVYAGELDVALSRAGAFCRIISAGRAQLAHDTDRTDGERGRAETESAASMLATAADLEAAAYRWRQGTLT